MVLRSRLGLASHRTRRRRASGETRLAALLFAPTALALVGLVALPLALSLAVSLTRVDVQSLRLTFVGLRQWAALLRDPLLATVLGNTALYWAATLVLGLAVSLPLAWLLTQEFPGRAAARVVLLIPFAIAPASLVVVWGWILNSSYGLLNGLLYYLGLTAEDTVIAYLTEPWPARASLIFVNLWRIVPFMTLLILAGLQAVSRDQLDAARVDGSGPWQTARHVVLPAIRLQIVAALVVASVWSIKTFDLVVGLTNGGPGHSTLMIYFYAYRKVFQELDFGYGAVLSYVAFALMAVAALVSARAHADAA